MPSRFLKQFIYGFFYLVIFLLIGYGVFKFSSPPPSCFDGIQNGSETGIDCGGSCVPCQIKEGRPLEVTSAELLPIDGEHTSVVISIRNPNATHGASDFTYTVTAFESNGDSSIIASGHSFIYPTEIKYLVYPALSLNYRLIKKIEVSVTDEFWTLRDNFNLPQLDTRQLEFSQQNNFIKLSGLVVSNEAAPFPEVIINALFYNEPNHLVGASQTVIYDLQSFEERRFEIFHPAVECTPEHTRLFISAKRPGVSGVSL